MILFVIYSAYPNVNDLFKVADILISDYSASMSDYAILERPVLCFTYDYEQYRDERGFIWNFDKICQSWDIENVKMMC